MIFRMDFDMFFGILIFDPKCRFFMGYSLCMMVDFQNGLICGIFSVFWSGSCTEHFLVAYRMDFKPVFWNFNFRPKVMIFHWL